MTKKYEPMFFILPALLSILVVVIYPIICATLMAFYGDVTLVSQHAPFVGITNFLEILNDQKYQRAVINTLIYTSVAVSGSFGVGFGAALLLQEIPSGKSVFKISLIIPMMSAPLVMGLTWRWMLDPLFGFINWLFSIVHLPAQTWLAQKNLAMLVVTLIEIWEWYPLVFLITYAGLVSLPREPCEAAAIDGASGWATFWYITLPALRPVILVVLLLRTIDAFRTFDPIKVLTDGGPSMATEVLSLYLYRMAFTFGTIRKAAAGTLIMLLVIGVIVTGGFKLLYKTERKMG